MEGDGQIYWTVKNHNARSAHGLCVTRVSQLLPKVAEFGGQLCMLQEFLSSRPLSHSSAFHIHINLDTMAAVPEVELKKTVPAVEKAEKPEEKGLTEDA